MGLNCNKTGIHGLEDHVQIIIKRVDIESVSMFKLLGVIHSDDLSYKEALPVTEPRTINVKLRDNKNEKIPFPQIRTTLCS